MSVNNPYQTYQNNTVTTASSGELTLMLYNGCLKFIKQAKDAMVKKDIGERNTNITKAQNIIRELMVTLDMEMAISQQIMPLYDYILHQLIQANVKNEPSLLDEASTLVTEFRDTWKQVIQIDRRQKYGQLQK